MVDATKFRSEFAEFLGEERFRKFVPCGSYLSYWQEKALEKFLAEHPEYALAEGELETILHICPIHRQEFRNGVAEVFEGCLDYTKRYLDARRALFPYAGMDPVSIEGRPAAAKQAQISYCMACHDARAEWVSSNA